MVQAEAVPTPKATRRKKNRKAPKIKPYIAYGQPDRKIIVRLLPPTLNEEDFMSQARAKTQLLDGDKVVLYYRQGTRAVKPFEDPIYSSMYVELPTKEQAEKLKAELDTVPFLEKATGDNVQCQVIKSIFEEMPKFSNVSRDTSDQTVSSEIFKAFCENRQNGTADAFVKSLEDRDKKKAKNQKRKQKEKKTSKPDQDEKDKSEAKDLKSKSSDDKGVKKKKKKVKDVKSQQSPESKSESKSEPKPKPEPKSEPQESNSEKKSGKKPEQKSEKPQKKKKPSKQPTESVVSSKANNDNKPSNAPDGESQAKKKKSKKRKPKESSDELVPKAAEKGLHNTGIDK